MPEGIHKIGAEAVAALKALNRAKADKKSKTAKATELIEERNEAVNGNLNLHQSHIKEAKFGSSGRIFRSRYIFQRQDNQGCR